MHVLFKFIALGITAWLLKQTLTLKYVFTRDLADLDWAILAQPVNLAAALLAVILLLSGRRNRSN